ncbi:hypothetical protein M422DRAFT_44409 [Sphaerobolus stellatus SS14]|nr:hypothetical protein M422DRAFT_44409 [Sphaerobolus stellatus SS14]
MAQDEFQVRVCTEYAFPEDFDSVMEECATETWENACERKGVSMPLTDDLMSLIFKHTSTIRGRVKDTAVKCVPSSYGFREPLTEDDIEYNKQLGSKLLKNLEFIYTDPENSRGMYEHPVLQSVINRQFFGKKSKSDGVVFSGAFNPMPEPTIALVFTAVQFAIKQWAANGVSNPTEKFSEEQWHAAYKTHLDGLAKWRDYNQQTARALARLKQRLFDIGSKTAGFQVKAASGEAFDDDVLARAAAALPDY